MPEPYSAQPPNRPPAPPVTGPMPAGSAPRPFPPQGHSPQGFPQVPPASGPPPGHALQPYSAPPAIEQSYPSAPAGNPSAPAGYPSAPVGHPQPMQPGMHPQTHYPVTGPHTVTHHSQVIVVEKNVAVATLLGFFFGPIGMIYATGIGALVMFGVNIVIGILTFGLGLFLTWPVCAIWAGVAAGNHNARARQQAYAAMNRPPGW
ncbi:hypothetical protein [Brevibacterium luteolum]|uniref:hypothetical protein n=1 Tax=Brevibacterium luteolum TaxID=199591 RepID=UPI001C2177E7|nr:hypothetical protein [Brevibacterium luteolum]MBU8579658.1 hypothetical protein [Brevibacterium luteolum]